MIQRSILLFALTLLTLISKSQNVSGSEVATTRSEYPEWFTPRNVEPIQPLITTHWSHCSPYNDSIPEKEGICATLAYAQLMHYYRASGCFTELYSPFDNVTLPPTTFNHDLILDEYDYTASEESRSEVAKLVRYCRYSFSSDSNGEEAFDLKWSDYSKTSWEEESLGMGRLRGMVYDTSEFLDSCLETGNPVIVFGYREDAGSHLSIIDGRDSEGRYHFNLGWGGLYDGYYEIANSMDDYRSTCYFDVEQFVLLDVKNRTTSIRVPRNKVYEDGQIYGLNGQVVNGNPRGLYIKNGKKHIYKW
jgi:hypothetical protein